MTYQVSELTAELSEVLDHAFPSLWVLGEAQRVRESRNGHLYFELVEKGRGESVVAKLDAVIWRRDHQRLRRVMAREGQRLADGQQIRCLARLDFYGPAGRLQLIVRDVDPIFTLGQLERRRRQVLTELAAAELLDANKAHPLPAVPLRVALITSEGSAAFHDFLTGLEASGYGFEVFFVHAAMQGVEAERQVASALALVGRRGERCDAVVLIRGGGSRTDLAAFDSRRIAEAVARCPVPVLTGLGHEIDQSITDRVGHTAFKTPTMVAEFLVDRVRRAEQAVERCAATLAHRAEREIERARLALERSERLVVSSRLRLQAARLGVDDAGRALALVGRRRLAEMARRLELVGRQLGDASRRSIERRRDRPEAAVRRLADAARHRLRDRTTLLDGLARVCHQLAPERLYERGFSTTRDAAGRIVTRPDQVEPGDLLKTRVAGGTVSSTVTGGEDSAQAAPTDRRDAKPEDPTTTR